MRRISARTAVAFFAAALTCGALAAPSGAANRSLPRVRGTAPQPGPAALYQPLVKAAQLENAPRSPGPAKPILSSGASAYRKGEYLYQGFIYDDRGAKEATDPSNPMHSPGGDASGGDLFSAPDGTYDYPSGPGYDENAADLVEVRVKPKRKATVFRITLNTLENADLVATAIAIGGTEGQSHPFPFGANVSAPAQYFLTVHGTTAVLTDAVSGGPVPGPAPTVSVDMTRRQITVQVLHSEWNPGTSTVRLAAGVGLWDSSTGSYLLPKAERSATEPGAGGRLRPHAAAALAVGELQPVRGLAQPVAVRQPGLGLDRDHAHRARAGRLVLRPRWRGHLRSLGRRGGALSPEPLLRGHSRVLDGRLRHVQVLKPVPRPLRPRAADRRSARAGDLVAARRTHRRPALAHAADARLGAQHPVLDLEPDHGRARPDQRRTRTGQTLRRTGLPLRVRRIPRGRSPDPGNQRRIQTGRRIPRHRNGQSQPGARQLHVQPHDGLPGRRDDPRSPALGFPDRTARRQRLRAPGS